VVTTISAPVFDGRRLLLCELLDETGETPAPSAAYMVAVDRVGAGAGERVLLLDEGTGARQILEEEVAPVRALIVGIIDAIDIAR
jgi:microcompartment protein CcmK/EutM